MICVLLIPVEKSVNLYSDGELYVRYVKEMLRDNYFSSMVGMREEIAFSRFSTLANVV